MYTIAAYQPDPNSEGFIITDVLEASRIDECRLLAERYAPDQVDQFWPQELTERIIEKLATPQAKKECLLVSAWGTPDLMDFLVGYSATYQKYYKHQEQLGFQP